MACVFFLAMKSFGIHYIICILPRFQLILVPYLKDGLIPPSTPIDVAQHKHQLSNILDKLCHVNGDLGLTVCLSTPTGESSFNIV